MGGTDLVMAGPKSGSTEVSGAYTSGTATSMFATSPMVVNTYPADRSSAYQSIPSTVISVDVAISEAGRATPHRSVIGGSPHAAVVVASGSVFLRTAVRMELGTLVSSVAQAAADSADVGVGSGTATGPAHPVRITATRAMPIPACRYTKMTLTPRLKGCSI